MIIEFLPLIFLGFSLGFMHALDADHVMAVSALSNQNPSFFKTLWFSANWALGHGGVLLISGTILFGLGISVPPSLQHVAEMSVGLLLIGIGLSIFWQFRQQKINMTAHHHGDIQHSHWHNHQHIENTQLKATKDTHLPIMVGSLHGLAGSAPALALIPIASQEQMSTIIMYLLVFSLGVMLSMMLFGLCLGSIQRFLKKTHQRAQYWSQKFIATTSILVGCFWFYKAF
ncbi:MAG: sulfite exporter TauE/SafE family protein [Colwellia sp.]|jgi:High-affinity nickel-transport protein.